MTDTTMTDYANYFLSLSKEEKGKEFDAVLDESVEAGFVESTGEPDYWRITEKGKCFGIITAGFDASDEWVRFHFGNTDYLVAAYYGEYPTIQTTLMYQDEDDWIVLATDGTDYYSIDTPPDWRRGSSSELALQIMTAVERHQLRRKSAPIF
jgi:hypothetical protein